MPDGRSVYVDVGPWKGDVEQPAEAGEGAFESSFNIALLNGEIQKRKGRVQLNTFFSVYPAIVAWQLDANEWYVITRDLSQSKFLSNAVGLGALGFTNNQTIYIGCPFPFNTWTVKIGTVNTNAVTMTVKYWNGSSAVSATITDGTQTGGKTFAQQGSVFFTNGVPSDWLPEQPIVNGVRLARMYYIRVSVTGAVSAGTSWGSDLQLELTNNTLAAGGGSMSTGGSTLTTAINGIIYMQLPSGERQVLVGMDDTVNGYARLFVYNWNKPTIFASGALGPATVGSKGTFKTIPLSATVGRTGVGAYWRGVPYGGKMILTNGFTPPLVYDGVTCEPLNALWGADSVMGGRTYTPAPTAKFLAAYNSALYAAGIQGAPRTVQRSENQNAFTVFTGSEQEQVGGANYWPAGQDFDVSTGDATRPETSECSGLGIVGGRLAILTRERPYLYDDSPELIPLGGNAGCIAPGSFVTVGDFGFYLGDRTIWKIDGEGRLSQIGLPIDVTLRSVLLDTQAIASAVAVVSPSYHEYRLYVPFGGDDRNRLCLVYDYISGTWTKRGGIPPNVPNNLGVAADPYANLNNFFVSAAARVNEIGEPETIFSGDYKGHLFLEDEGEADSLFATDTAANLTHYPIFSYIVTSRIGKDSVDRKLFREFFLFARKSGGKYSTQSVMNMNVYMVTNEQDALGTLHSALIESRTLDYLAQGLNGDFIVPAPETETWFGISPFFNPTHAPQILTGPLNSASKWSTNEFRPFKYSFQTASQSGLNTQRWSPTAQFVIWSNEPFMPFAIRGWEVAYTRAPETLR